jgi:hypothetical protein
MAYYPEKRVLKRRSTDPAPPAFVERRVAQTRVHVQGPFELDGPTGERTRVAGRRSTDQVQAAPRRA